jgi:hypothetical protein
MAKSVRSLESSSKLLPDPYNTQTQQAFNFSFFQRTMVDDSDRESVEKGALKFSVVEITQTAQLEMTTRPFLIDLTVSWDYCGIPEKIMRDIHPAKNRPWPTF